MKFTFSELYSLTGLLIFLLISASGIAFVAIDSWLWKRKLQRDLARNLQGDYIP